ncbi:MAG: hypothetical protein AAF921_07115 [Cyanobacteria bacterium P01_D01_bin.44]
MKFEYDIFISYAHIDNLPLEEEQEGWISHFHRALEIRLAQLRGENPRIWRDLKLQGNDYFSDTILDTFSKVGLLISILSPRYIKSEWCLRELTHFHQAVTDSGGIRIANKSRIFKVIKTYLPLEQHPSELEPLLGYAFYEFDDARRPREFSQIFGAESQRKYWAKLEDLAYDICKALEEIDSFTPSPSDESEPLNPAAEIQKTIYLAEVPLPLEDERDKVRRELELKGHQVLPDQPLLYAPDFRQKVQADLARSSLSIHLIDNQPVTCSIADVNTSAELQSQLAIARSREQIDLAAQRSQDDCNFARILWMPPTDQPLDTYLKDLQNDPDFLSTSLEDLKTFIQDRIDRPAHPLEALADTDSSLRLLLDCDQQDLESSDLDPLYDYLEQQFDVVLPDYDISGVTSSESLLRQCDAVLIYYGQASGLWLKRRINALKKTLYGRFKPLLAQAVYVAAPLTPTKQRLCDPGIPVIQAIDTFTPTVLDSFLAQVSHP